ncbi:hypothetical protein BpHYR1_008205 [Brachionus plicatilis]|uniref:Uncharacterized protein n=1 Tax=Brachionus plicatilis TaxID=10195 RepID=A0A3M7QPG5_BRAPC|nr:hypothetical protein BpHYR1_008205 [Brachionus plicatilis]
MGKLSQYSMNIGNEEKSLWTLLFVAFAKILYYILESTKTGIIIYTHNFVSRTREYHKEKM